MLFKHDVFSAPPQNPCHYNLCDSYECRFDGAYLHSCLCNKEEVDTSCGKPGKFYNICLIENTNDLFCSACLKEADIVFMLDASGSVGLENWRTTVSFILNFVHRMQVSQKKVRIGLVTFATTAKIEFDLDKYGDIGAVANAIYKAHYSRGGTNIAAAFEAARGVFQQSKQRQVHKMAVLLTDGRPNVNTWKTHDAADSLKNTINALLVIGVGNGMFYFPN